LIKFLERAFGAPNVQKYASPDGVVHHAQVTIGTSVVEMGEAHGPYQPMPTMFYLYVESVDALYRRALEAGAASTSEPADQADGDRRASVKDPFGNHWRANTGSVTTPHRRALTKKRFMALYLLGAIIPSVRNKFSRRWVGRGGKQRQLTHVNPVAWSDTLFRSKSS
jgi:PhnB protein